MRRALLSSIVVLALGIGPAAQEGHPLTGTWYGDYGTARQRIDLTVVMKWDGRAVSGTINPGPNAVPLAAAAMDITPGKPAPDGQDSTTGIPPTFHVRLEADLPDASGGKSRVVFQGDIRNPVAGNRRIEGTWTRGAEKGTFQLRRL
jgi:hypothetical protein